MELLVSLAILGLTSALLVQGLHGGWRVWDRIEARGRAGETVLAAQARLAELIARATPQTSFAGSRPFARFDGASNRLTFLADPGGGPQLLTVALAADGRIGIARQPDLPASASPPAPTTAPLIDGAATLDLTYFGAAPPDNERRWRTGWSDQPSLPELVRVRVAFVDGDRRMWPELIVHPAATIDTACVFVPATGHCKGRG